MVRRRLFPLAKNHRRLRYNEDVQQAIARVAVWQAECNGYYRAPNGRVVTQWPYSMSEFRRRTSVPDADAYESAPL